MIKTFAEFFTPAFVEKQKTATNLEKSMVGWVLGGWVWVVYGENLSLLPPTSVTSCRHLDPLKMLKVAAEVACYLL